MFCISINAQNVQKTQKKIIIFSGDYSKNYMIYAAKDLAEKNFLLYSDFYIIPNNASNTYKNIKLQIKELTINNDADVSAAYDVLKYQDGFVLNYIIFDTEYNNKWIEKSVYSKEDDFYISVNKMIEDIYKYSLGKNENIKQIEKDEYVSLIGYYLQKVNIINNDIDINDEKEEKSMYDLFFNFYKDNIYFNIDYTDYLIINSDKSSINNLKSIADNIKSSLNKTNHYYLYALGCYYYNKYKVNVIADDIDLSIENYQKAINMRENNYKYYERLANAYILKNDYDNASKYYKTSIDIFDRDISLIKNAIYFLKKDMSKNGNLVIDYLQKIVSMDKNDCEALEELAIIYQSLGDINNAEIYYKKLLEAINYHLYIINNEKPNAILYDKYMKQRNNIEKKIINLRK